jgi:hypothetical protein
LIIAAASASSREIRSVEPDLRRTGPRLLEIASCNPFALGRKRVTVIDYPEGRLAIRYNGVDLPYRTFDKRPQVNQAAIVENKRLGPILAYIAEQQKKLDMSRSAKATRSEKPHVQGRLDEHPGGALRVLGLHAPPSHDAAFNPLTQGKAANLSRPSDISKWSKS